MSSIFEEERERQAYIMNTTPPYVTRAQDGSFWFNLEYEIASNQSFGNQLVSPTAFIDRLQPILDPSYPLKLTPQQLGMFYVYANPVVQSFLKPFVHSTAEDAVWQLNGVLGNSLSMELQVTLKDLIKTLFSYIKQWGEKQGIQKCLDEQVAPEKISFRTQYEAKQRLNAELERYSIPHSEFTLKNLVRQFRIVPQAVEQIETINRLFDRATVSSLIPLIVTSDIHKVLKGHTYELLPLPKDSLQVETMYLWTTLGRVDVQFKQGDIQPEIFISYNLKQLDEDDSDLIQLICLTLQIKVEDLELLTTGLNGLVTFPTDVTFHPDLWRDFVMNDERVIPFLTIDETQLTEERENEADVDSDEFVEFVPVSNPKIPHVFLAYGVRFQVELNSEQLILYFENVQSLEVGNRISKRMAELFGLFKKIRRDLLREYEELTENFPVLLPPEVAQKGKKRKKKPEIYKIFGPNFSRYVNKVPSLLTESEAKEVEQSGFQVIAFPKLSDLPPGESPMYFSCHTRTDEYIYPGLLLNPAPGGTYPLLPCCYKEDQRQKRNSNAYEYYQTEANLETFRARQKDRSFLDVGQIDDCPEMINNLYFLNGFIAPKRVGMHRGPLSALECILCALNIADFQKQNSVEKLRRLDSEVARLSRDYPYYAALCAQECWDCADVRLSTEEYFDLRQWIRLVEEAYTCRVVMLGTNNFIFPKHIQGRWMWLRDSTLPVIVIYEHYGTTTVARATYPQCEWITFTDSSSVTDHHFVDEYAILASGSADLVVDQIRLFDALTRAEMQLSSQHIDFYGKVFAWNVVRRGQEMTLHFRQNRLPPLHFPRAESFFTGRVDDLASGSATNRQYFRLGDIEVFVETFRENESLRESYDFFKRQVQLLLENAKRVYALRINSGESLTDWSFIKIDPARSYQPYDRFRFQSNDKIYVPNVATKERLQYSLSLFQKRQEWELYYYAGLQVVPFRYKTLADFQVQSNAVVMTNQRKVRWDKELYHPRTLTGSEPPIREPFLTWIQHVLFRCDWIEEFPNWNHFRLYFPQTRQIFVVGEREIETDQALLVLKHPATQVLTYYSCRATRLV